MERQHRKLGSKGYLILIKSANLDAELRGAENVAAVISSCLRIRMLVCYWWMSACYCCEFYNVAPVECVEKYILQNCVLTHLARYFFYQERKFVPTLNCVTFSSNVSLNFTGCAASSWCSSIFKLLKRIVSCHILPYCIASHRIVSYHIQSYRTALHHVISCRIESYCIVSYHFISCPIISSPTALHHMVSYHVVSCSILSNLILSYCVIV